MKKIIAVVIIGITVFNCDDIIEVVDISDETIEVLAPKDGTILEVSDINFSWNPVDETDSYKVQIATPNFESATQILVDSILTKTSLNFSLPTGDYEWRVRAENSAYQSFYSSQHFTVLSSGIVDISNQQIQLLTPVDNQTFSTTDTVNFSWETVEGANEYIIQIASPDFENAEELIKNETVNNGNYSISNLSAGNHKWRVKAINEYHENEFGTLNFQVN